MPQKSAGDLDNCKPMIKAQKRALRIAGIYAGVGIIWITISDRLLGSLVKDSATFELFSIYKGWGFILVTATLVFSLTRRALKGQEHLTEALRINEAKFRSYVERAPHAVFVTDRHGLYVDYNAAALDLLGYNAAALERMRLSDVVADEDRDGAMRDFASLIAEGRITGEYRMKRSDGGIVWISLHGVKVTDDRFMAFCQDITERKHAETALLESESRFRLAMDATSDGLWEWDIPSGYTYFSPAYFKMLGYEPGELESSFKTWVELIHPDDRDHALSINQECVENRRDSFQAEFRMHAKNGEWRWILGRGKTVKRDSNGRAIFIVGTHVDITERKIAEEALRTSEEKYRLVVENANDAIFIVQDGMIKFKFPNRRLMSISGYTEEELTGVPFSSFIHADDRDMVLGMHRKRLLGQDVPDTYSFRSINKAGQTIWVEVSAVLIDWEGRPATLNFLRDITIQRKLEEQLLHAQKMEAIGTLAGGVAHDFNNLLMGIMGYTSLMLMKTDKTHPFYEKLKTIEHQAESGAELTRQLLGFARGGKYQVRPANVNDLITKTADIFGRTKKEITIHRKLRQDLHTTEADTGQIEQVLFNLYVNAWQSMPSGGRLYIETQNVILDEQQCRIYDAEPGPYVMIAVTDTGVGMDSETQKRIFEPFFTTRGVQGTGLGLASAYGIIRNHGGIINVNSEKGRGTTFTVYLPASGAKASETKPADNGLLAGHETILIVDDEPLNIGAVKELLEALGYKVLTAQSGSKAIEIYRDRSGEIQLVLLDMIMPEMNGRETLLKLMEINNKVRVLLSSGYSIDGEAAEILAMGCKGFIQKPFKVEELSLKIRDVLDSADS